MVPMLGCRQRVPLYRRSVTYTLAEAGAFDRRTANETRIASAIMVPPMAFMMMPSSVHSEYLVLLEEDENVNQHKSLSLSDRFAPHTSA